MSNFTKPMGCSAAADKSISESYCVAAFYHFTFLSDCGALRSELTELCRTKNICGTILLAEEGINGTIAGTEKNTMEILAFLKRKASFRDLEYKLSYAAEKPFLRMKVRLKTEIIRMGISGESGGLGHKRGDYVSPQEWNDLLARDDVVVLDVRNNYETAIGGFASATDPNLNNFGDFPQFVDTHKDAWRGKKIACYCTGGIRCEKASAYLLEAGFDEVYQLHGGILKYLEQMPPAHSRWHGDCFVFDRRVSLKHGLALGDYGFCGGCRAAVSAADREHPHFEAGVSCPQCYHSLTERQRLRFTERQKQIRLAESRNSHHLGEV